MKSLRIAAFILVCVLAAVVVFAAPGAARAQTGGVNLLVDGDFEAPPTWPQQDGIGEVQVAPGWRARGERRPEGVVAVRVGERGGEARGAGEHEGANGRDGCEPR